MSTDVLPRPENQNRMGMRNPRRLASLFLVYPMSWAGHHKRRVWDGTAVVGGCLAVVAPFIFALIASAAVPPRISRLDETDLRTIERGRAEFNAGRREEGFRILDSLASVAVARRDLVLQDWVTVAKAALHAWGSEARAADSLLAPILGRIEARGDTVLYLSAAMWDGKALLDLGRFAAAESVYRPLVAIASRRRNEETEGWAQMGLAYVALQSGRDEEARTGYRAAERRLRASGNRYGELEALTGLSRTYADLDSFQACCIEVLSRARGYTLPKVEATALGNLGNVEIVRGDPAAGVRYYREACRILRSAGDRRMEIGPATNLARALVDLGRFDEATSVLDSLTLVCRQEGFADYQAQALEALGRLHAAAGHPRRARQAYREIIQLGERVPVSCRLDAQMGLAELLDREDSPLAALALLESPGARRLRSHGPTATSLEYDHERAALLLKTGRFREAAAAAEAVALEAPRVSGTRLHVLALTTAARARLALGDHEAAWRDVQAAVDAWERFRDRPSEPEWRERWTDGQRLTSTLIQALLCAPGSTPAARTRAAFEEAQRFKTRGLAERMQSVHHSVPRATPVSLERLQREILRPGELLLDAFVGPDSSFVFVVTRDRCEAVGLPGEAVLAEKIRLLHGFLSAAPSRTTGAGRAGVFQEIARGAGDFLLGSVRDLVAGSDRILFAPDGPLHLLALDALRFDPPDDSADRKAIPARVIARIPSVAQLIRMRKETRPADARPDDGLILVGAVNADGERLGGARAEARLLARRFRDFSTREETIDSATVASTGWLSRFSVLHFAAHAELNEQYPWRSGVLLEGTPAGGRSVVLRAERIAASPLSTKLAVVSSCESARGHIIRGEGIQGLSTAFLAAGARSVVATLWPVQDRATAAFMARFYDGLERGQTVGESLREAKQTMAQSTDYADPFYWAGFVLIGDPDQRLILRPRPHGTMLPWLAAGGLAALFFRRLATRSRRESSRAKSPVIPAPGKRPT